MARIVLTILAILLASALWAGGVVVATLEGWGRRPLAAGDDPAAFLTAVRTETAGHTGNLALVLVEDGKPAGTLFIQPKADPAVDGDTLFQVASLSKWIAAWGVMRLVEEGKVDLDAPVDSYLKRWKLPPGEFDNRQVTVRRLLSHTAGLTDGLGYGGFAPGEPIQSLEQSLTRASDASPGRDGITRVGKAPGSGFAYSGGGYTLLQLLIEDVAGEPFAAYMQRTVLGPLGMTRSTYLLPEGGVDNLAPFYDTDGSRAVHYRFTATAAASLYTSTGDLTRFLQAHHAASDGAPGRGVLKPGTLALMRKPHASQYGADIWGLGLVLYAPTRSGGWVIGHDGGNAPAINTTARIDPESGDGIVVLETGAPALASKVAGHWVFWKTGKVDLVDVIAAAPGMVRWIAGGAAVILGVGVALSWLTRRRRRRV
ncbi:MAG: serine hydrolase domain-containing protein [Pseudomonadota bacterium]